LSSAHIKSWAASSRRLPALLKNSRLTRSSAALGRRAVLVARLTGHDRKTSRRLLREGWAVAPQARQVSSKLDQVSSHVLAAAIVAAARQHSLRLSLPSEVREETGAGVTGLVEGRLVKLGKRSWVVSETASSQAGEVQNRAGLAGRTTVFCSVDGHLAGALLLEDPIRQDAPQTLAALRRAGIGTMVMLTGDHAGVAERVSAALGLDRTLAQLSPAGKIEAVRLARREGTTVMVGDGINDAPALAAADVGVAMGARGATASSEAADVVMIVDRLDRLADAISIARRARAIAVQSVMVGMGLSMGAMIAAFGGLLPPVAGALVQECIDLAVILNALRALGGPVSFWDRGLHRFVRPVQPLRGPAIGPALSARIGTARAGGSAIGQDVNKVR